MGEAMITLDPPASSAWSDQEIVRQPEVSNQAEQSLSAQEVALPTILSDPSSRKHLEWINARFGTGELVYARVAPGLESRFRQLADQWTNETGRLSSPQQKVMHPAYQQIIGMGPPALPLIFVELRDRPAYWFWALTAIVGVDIAEGAATMEDARERWLSWGNQRGY